LLLVGILALPGAAVAAQSTGSAVSPTEDSVTGEAVPDFVPPKFGTPILIDARSGPSGENPSGRVTIVRNCDIYIGSCASHTTEYGGLVTCLNVNDNRAIIGYYGGITNPDFSSVPPNRFRGLVEVIDNGSLNLRRDGLIVHWMAEPVPDFLGNDEPFGPHNPEDVPITDCPDTLPASTIIPGTSADRYWISAPPGSLVPVPFFDQDFTVVDGQPPRPTAKDQCKNNGWRNFGDAFNNQGQCVAFVERGTR
jgi:hypothetical protein